MDANREYKKSVFSLLFGSDPTVLRELYAALAGLTLPPETPVVINTLEGVLYMARLNDLSFMLAGRLIVLIEHQSTINPNMAFRLLLYAARVYEKITREQNLSGMAPVIVPRPEFIVLYNGAAPYPDREQLKLSDAFADASVLGISGDAALPLELIVKVYNINEGRNEEVLARCETLKAYSTFIARAREYGAETDRGGRGAAIKRAVEWCIGHDVLKEFLSLHGTEVLNMLLEEWSIEDIAADNARYMLEKGLAEGLEKGLAEGLEKGLAEGREEGVIKVARNLLTKGLPVELIQEATGLNRESLQSLGASVSP